MTVSADARHDPDFVARATAIVRLGSVLLQAGTASYRVKRAMQRTALKLGMDQHQSAVSLTEITATAYQGDNFRTVVTEVPRVGVDAVRIEAVEDLSRRLPAQASADDVNAGLDRIEATVGPRWGQFWPPLAAGVACAAFAVLNRFAWWDAVPILLAAMLGQAVRMQLARRHINPFAVVAVAAGVACAAYWVLALLGHQLPGLPRVSSSGYVASVLFLIPGFPMMTSILDIAKLDFTAGVSRAVYAFSTVMAATAAVWLVSSGTGLAPLPESIALAWWTLWASRVLATMFGIAGFAVLFNSSRRMVLLASAIGLVGNIARFTTLDLHGSPQLGSFVGGIVIGLLAAGTAHPLHVPRITVSVPASVIMVPGTAIYRTMFYLNSRDVPTALGFGADACLNCVAIALGLVAARIITDRHWSHGSVLTRADVARPE